MPFVTSLPVRVLPSTVAGFGHTAHARALGVDSNPRLARSCMFHVASSTHHPRRLSEAGLAPHSSLALLADPARVASDPHHCLGSHRPPRIATCPRLPLARSPPASACAPGWTDWLRRLAPPKGLAPGRDAHERTARFAPHERSHVPDRNAGVATGMTLFIVIGDQLSKKREVLAPCASPEARLPRRPTGRVRVLRTTSSRCARKRCGRR